MPETKTLSADSSPSAPTRALNVTVICPDCRNPTPNIVEEFASGDLVCGDCGLVLGDRIIDTRSEWRTFANDEGDDPSRRGAGTAGQGLARDLNRIHGRSTAQRHERNLVQAYKEISALCDAYDLPKVIGDVAKQLYKKVEDENLQRGKNNDAIIAACIFLACRQEGVPRTFKEICALTKGVTSSDDLILRFCSNLTLDMETQRIAELLSQKAKDMDKIAGKSPVSIASACIYMASHLTANPKDAKAISSIAGVGEATIKTTYKILYANRKQLVTPDILARSSKASLDNLITP
ncbi:cyclin-like protein [Linderina pennispora]|uniref:Transcription initiation factor IIB n=1 Tax=Linderina pennispora TaxID=61395 RepID=A0A1Y1WGF4_9FUNG|nr:cyclin-like protein [Linderina pennispora]ORX72613.1 cyclin-like protein [Linderina pennispora]